MDANRDRLAAKINERRVELRLRWSKVAQDAGMDTSNLRRIRYGDIAVSELAARGIEDALRWEPGSVAAILAGDEPTSQPDPEPEDPRMMLVRETYEEWRREYGNRRALQMINEVLADARDSTPNHELTDERGAG